MRNLDRYYGMAVYFFIGSFLGFMFFHFVIFFINFIYRGF